MPKDTQPSEEQIEKQLKRAVTESLWILYERDIDLIERDVHERSIVFRFGVYFQQIVDVHQWFQGYNIDVEYNRNMLASKDIDGNLTYPDFIVHKRKKNSNNLLILEFKKIAGRGADDDYRRILKYMEKNRVYRYRYGASIILKTNVPEWRWMDRENFRENREPIPYPKYESIWKNE